jgi:hypothetical protein
MALIDKRLLVEECLTIILKIHKIRAPEEIIEENTDLQQRFSIYAQFMEKDLDELVKLSKELRAELDLFTQASTKSKQQQDG